MGRGGSEQALDAKNLLYGPRRGRVLTSEQRKVRKTKQRQESRQRDIEAFTNHHSELRQSLLGGRARDFLELDPAGHGLKGVEKKELRQTIDQFEVIAEDAFDRHSKNADMIESVDDLDGLIALYDLCRQAKLPESVSERARMVAIRYGHALSNEAIIDDLELDQDVIGPLPQTMYGSDYACHLTVEGSPLCDSSISAYRPGRYRPESVITQPANCQACRELYQNNSDSCHDKIDKLEPSQWFSGCLEKNSDYFGVYSDDDLSDEGEDRAEKMLEIISKRTREHLDHNLKGFSDYRLNL